jgi:hypothetical protein
MECKVKCFFSIFVQEWLEKWKGASLFFVLAREKRRESGI